MFADDTCNSDRFDVQWKNDLHNMTCLERQPTNEQLLFLLRSLSQLDVDGSRGVSILHF